MDIVDALAAKGELITLKEKLITLGLEIDGGKASKVELIKRVAKCVENVEELEAMVRFDYDEN
ncbi:hypothetical protein [Rossellomorea aquimaris]|jgi:hypothetical protein|uniref:Uncharacterized protein n=1 Tax=Rossellomorea aquimaris TaxID=189382 RepID=A0A1J6WGR7_9BACI|nr:hypothetical protein [Rossellomorea aquimaris]OIU71064.1 hypothetical protein BHE18_08435 [Rossellomorea aquimaris]